MNSNGSGRESLCFVRFQWTYTLFHLYLTAMRGVSVILWDLC